MITVVAERKTFENRRAISLRVPEGTKKIEHGAFCAHSLAEYIEIPDGVTTIEEMAFGYCRNLKAITIPGSVISICQKAFVNCENLSEVVLRESQHRKSKRFDGILLAVRPKNCPDRIYSITHTIGIPR